MKQLHNDEEKYWGRRGLRLYRSEENGWTMSAFSDNRDVKTGTVMHTHISENSGNYSDKFYK